MRAFLPRSLAFALTCATACSLTSKLGLPTKKADAQPQRVADRDDDDDDDDDRPKPPADLPKGDPSSDGDELREVFVSSEPQHGHKKLEAMSPPWCAVAGKMRPDGNARALGRALGGYANKTIQTVGTRLCVYPNDPVYMAQTAHFIQGFMNRTGLDKEAAIFSLTTRMNEERWEKQRVETCERYRRSDQDVGRKAAEIAAMRDLFGCGHGDSPRWFTAINVSGFAEFAFYYDVSIAPPSELLRVYYLQACYRHPDALEEPTEYDYRAYALCHADREAMNRKALETELVRDKHNDFAIAVARESFTSAAVSDAVLRRGLDKAIGKEPAYKTIFVDAPAAGWKRWEAAYKKNKTAFAAAAAMEALLFGDSRKAMRACGDAQREGFATYLANSRPGDFESAKRSVSDAVGRPLLSAVSACAAVHNRQAEYHALKQVQNEGQRARGPRGAALLAAGQALGELLADRPRFAVSTAVLEPAWNNSYIQQVGAVLASHKAQALILEPGGSVVASIKSHPDGKLITFQTKSYREKVSICKDSRKIWKIEDGKIYYHRSCRAAGSRTVKETVPPIIIPAYAAAGIAKGSFVEFHGGHPAVTGDKPREAYPVAVYKSPKKSVLLAAFGYAVK